MSHPRTATTPIVSVIALGLALAITAWPGAAPAASASSIGTEGDVIIELPPTVTVQPAVTITAATCTAPGSVTLSSDREVIWFIDGAETAPGTHVISDARTVIVEAGPYLGAFAPGIRTAWTIAITAPTGCESGSATPAETPRAESPAPPATAVAPVTPSRADSSPAAPAPAPQAGGTGPTAAGTTVDAPTPADDGSIAPAPSTPAASSPDSTAPAAVDGAPDVELPTLALASTQDGAPGEASLTPTIVLLLVGLAVLLIGVLRGRRPVRR